MQLLTEVLVSNMCYSAYVVSFRAQMQIAKPPSRSTELRGSTCSGGELRHTTSHVIQSVCVEISVKLQLQALNYRFLRELIKHCI